MSVEVVSGVRIVQCHAIIDVVIDVRVMQCHASMDVVIGVRVVLCHQAIDNSGFSTFLNFPLRVQILILSSSCINSSSLFPCSHFVLTFAPRKRHLRCGICNVKRNSKSQRSDSGRLRTFLVLYTPLVVIPSCHLGSSFACLAPPGRIGMKYTRSPNSTSCLRYGLPACNSYAVRPSQPTSNLSPRVFHEKRQDGMSRKYFAFHALFHRTLHHSYLLLCFTHRHFNGAIRLMLINRTLLHHKFNCGHRLSNRLLESQNRWFLI